MAELLTITSNDHNYATPPSSYDSIIEHAVVQPAYNPFMLSSNILDGTCYPIEGEIGLWSSIVSDSVGALPSPFIVSMTGTISLHCLRLCGLSVVENYPVDFSIAAYKNNNLVYYKDVTGNTSVEYFATLSQAYDCDKVSIAVFSISAVNSPVQLVNIFQPHYLQRNIDSPISLSEDAIVISDIVTG